MMLGERVFGMVAARQALSVNQAAALDVFRDLPDVPVLSETLLLMEFKVRERVVDLGEISRLVLSDVGATIQVMRLSGIENLYLENRLTRIEDCIADLGVHSCLEVMSRQTLKRSTRKPAVLEAWLHARIIAENCRFLAEEEFPSVHPDEAYLVGLLHAIGDLPSILGWQRTAPLFNNPGLVGLRMAQAWSLPECVVQYFSDLRLRPSPSVWTSLVEQAHAQAGLVAETADPYMQVSMPPVTTLQLVSSQG
ncbi:MAG TPA: HDOD domain-containing protein [Terracidiphilus sp.]|nr:HDOD domain-containing protein [Terracidiphilus sp.]